MNNFWFNVRVGRWFLQWHRGDWTPHATRMTPMWMHNFRVPPYSVRVFTLFGREIARRG